MPTADPLHLTGTTIAAKYAVESVVGEGGFAVVYRAMHLVWKRPVAIKAFKTMGDFASTDRTRLLDAFVREGALLADLSERSAAICQARDVGTLTTPEGLWVPYMVLEWLEGVTLERALFDEKRLKLAPRSMANAVALLDPVAEALALAHVRGIAHRDVKPGNVFLLGDPRSNPSAWQVEREREEPCPVKLLDFGIAKVVQDAQKMAGAFQKTAGHVTSFTPAYGAPEQFSRSHGATGPWTDVFALALVLSQIVSGREPLEGDNLSQLAFASMDSTRRPTPRTLGVPVPDAVEAVMVKALAPAAGDRYASVGEFWNALRAALGLPSLRLRPGAAPSDRGGGRDSFDISASSAMPLTDSRPDVVSARPTRPAAPSASEPAPMATAASRTTARTPRSSSPVVLGIFAAAAVVAAGGGGILVAKRAAPNHAAAPLANTTNRFDLAAAPQPPPPAAARVSCPAGMIAIPGGKFFMGSDDRHDLESERPAHQVSLEPYCIDRYEVKTADYRACSDRGECKRASLVNEWVGISEKDRKAFDPLCNARDPDGKKDHPINCVDWEMAAGYCNALGKRLPTEAEWEFSARGPDGRRYPWGDADPDGSHLNACGAECLAWGKEHKVDVRPMYEQDDGWATTAPVGSFPKGASRYGVEDVVGNVWEWVDDWYAPYPRSPDAETTSAGRAFAADTKPSRAPKSVEGRVIRGGAWNGSYPAWVRPTFRYHDAPTKRSYGIGFRCAAALAHERE